MATPGPVLYKRLARASKLALLVDKVELIEANPRYARVRFFNGTEDTLPNKRFAPSSGDAVDSPIEIEHLQNDNGKKASVHDQNQADCNDQIKNVKSVYTEAASEQPQPLPRHSRRARRLTPNYSSRKVAKL